MKKLLILALLFWGCDYAPTEHTHKDDSDLLIGKWNLVETQGYKLSIDVLQSMQDLN